MWWWVLIWVLLVVIAAAYLASRLWALWGQLRELTVEAERAGHTLGALETQLDRLGEAPEPAPPAVFGDPRALRRQREATRRELRRQRQARRAAHQPPWARP